MLGKLGLPEILLILAIALLIFGPSKLADLGKGLGEGIKNFKSAVKEGEGGEKKTAMAEPAQEDETDWPEERSSKAPPPVEKKGGCGCRVIDGHSLPANGVWLGLALGGAWMFRRRQARRA